MINITKRDLINYSAIATPVAFAGMPLYIHAPDYYATNFNTPIGLMGVMLLFLRFFDAIMDPFIGSLSDHYAKFRHYIILVASILLVISFALLFLPFYNPIVWFCLNVFLATTAFSILSINVNTLGGLWSKDPQQKTLIATTREGLGIIGLCFAVLMPSILQQYFSPKIAFLFVSFTLLGLIIIALILFWFWQKKYLKLLIYPAKDRFNFAHLKKMPKVTKHFFGVYALSMLATSMPALLVLFFIRDRIGLENYTGLFLMLYFLAGAFGMPIWQKLGKKYDKYTTWLIAMLLAVLSFIWATFLGLGNGYQYAIICLTSGVAFGADLAMPAAILAEHIHSNKLEQDASMYYSVLAFLAKFSLALASFIALPILDLFGFIPGQSNTQAALVTLNISYAFIPCCLKITAIIMLKRLKANITGDVNA